jgi:hypothetical protein
MAAAAASFLPPPHSSDHKHGDGFARGSQASTPTKSSPRGEPAPQAQPVKPWMWVRDGKKEEYDGFCKVTKILSEKPFHPSTIFHFRSVADCGFSKSVDILRWPQGESIKNGFPFKDSSGWLIGMRRRLQIADWSDWGAKYFPFFSMACGGIAPEDLGKAIVPDAIENVATVRIVQATAAFGIYHLLAHFKQRFFGGDVHSYRKLCKEYSDAQIDLQTQWKRIGEMTFAAFISVETTDARKNRREHKKPTPKAAVASAKDVPFKELNPVFEKVEVIWERLKEIREALGKRLGLKRDQVAVAFGYYEACLKHIRHLAIGEAALNDRNVYEKEALQMYEQIYSKFSRSKVHHDNALIHRQLGTIEASLSQIKAAQADLVGRVCKLESGGREEFAATNAVEPVTPPESEEIERLKTEIGTLDGKIKAVSDALVESEKAKNDEAGALRVAVDGVNAFRTQLVDLTTTQEKRIRALETRSSHAAEMAALLQQVDSLEATVDALLVDETLGDFIIRKKKPRVYTGILSRTPAVARAFAVPPKTSNGSHDPVRRELEFTPPQTPKRNGGAATTSAAASAAILSRTPAVGRAFAVPPKTSNGSHDPVRRELEFTPLQTPKRNGGAATTSAAAPAAGDGTLTD